jgi:hypothetical protein
MIPTHVKAKLPKHLSYPIGAKSLSEGLAGVPHVEAMSVWFIDHAVWPGAEFRRLLRDSVPYAIVRAEFHPARKPGYSGSLSMMEMGWYDETWRIIVNPVLRDLRHRANRLLREQGLGWLAQWLQSSLAVDWTSQYQTCELIFDPNADSLSVHCRSS